MYRKHLKRKLEGGGEGEEQGKGAKAKRRKKAGGGGKKVAKGMKKTFGKKPTKKGKGR